MRELCNRLGKTHCSADIENKIIEEMVKLQLMFYWPYTVDMTKTKVLYKWTNEHAEELYRIYEKLLALTVHLKKQLKTQLDCVGRS